MSRSAVLKGGRSLEREVSLRAGARVEDALKRLGHEAIGVDVALLIDVWRAVGMAGMIEVDLGTRQNRHRPLHELAPMAAQVAAAILERSGRWPEGEVLPYRERPPLAPSAA